MRLLLAVVAGHAGGVLGDATAQTGRIAEYVDPVPIDAAGEEAEEYISIDVRDKDLGDVLRGISRKVGVNIVADPEVKEKVTVTLDKVEWRKALEHIARVTHCQIIDESDRLIRLAQPPSISMEFQDADLKIVLDLLAKQSGANIVIAEDVTGKVSLALRGVPWRDALDTIVKTAGYVTVTEDSRLSPIIRVVRPESLKQQLVSRFFQLRYIRPEDPYKAIITDIQKHAVAPFLDPEGKPLGGTGPADAGEGARSAFTLRDALEKIISKDGSIEYDPNTNSFYVKDIKPKLDEIERIIKEVDREQPLIHIRVRFVTTSNRDVLERGIKVDNPETPEREGLLVNVRGATPDPLATDPVLFWGGTFPFDLGRWESLRDNFRALGILDFTQTELLLRLVKDDDNSRIVQEPQLTTLDNKPATIFVGETVPFAEQHIQADQNGNLRVTIEENRRSPINIGFTLYITPHVIPGTDTINLNVIPKVSGLSGTTSPITGFERFSFIDPETQTMTFIDLPREASQTVVTYMRVHDQHTAVIGGLLTERRSEISTKIPILSSVPILGNIFTWKRYSQTVESLLILITPRILRDLDMAEEVNRRALEEHRRYDYFWQKYEKEKYERAQAAEGGGAAAEKE